MYTNHDLIKKGYEAIPGNKWLLAIAIVIIVSILGGGANTFDSGLGVLVSVLLGGALNVGQCTFYLNIAKGREAGFEDVFEGFKNNYVQILIASLLMALLIILGFLLLIVPGIIMALGLSQTYFILAEDKNIQAVDALKKSWTMMDGYKVKLFLLYLIFIVMVLLGIVALIIGVFFVIPVIYSTLAQFYQGLKNNEIKMV